MSMMVNPSGGGQVVAAGQPFKLRLPKKKTTERPVADEHDPATDATDATNTDEEDHADTNKADPDE